MEPVAIAFEEVAAFLAGLTGERAWSPRIGADSMLALELGAPGPRTLTRDGRIVEHGTWHVWVYDGTWRIEQRGRVLATRDSDPEQQTASAQLLDGRTVEHAAASMLGHLTITLTDDLTLRCFPARDPDAEHWILFVPDGRAITATTRGRFLAEPPPQPQQ